MEVSFFYVLYSIFHPSICSARPEHIDILSLFLKYKEYGKPKPKPFFPNNKNDSN